MKKLLSLFLIGSFLMHSCSFAQINDIKELDSFYKRFKLGVSCYMKGKSCAEKDKEAVLKAAKVIIPGLVALSGAGILYFFRNYKIGNTSGSATQKPMINPSQQQLLETINAAQDQQAEKDKQLVLAVHREDLEGVKFLLGIGARRVSYNDGSVVSLTDKVLKQDNLPKKRRDKVQQIDAMITNVFPYVADDVLGTMEDIIINGISAKQKKDPESSSMVSNVNPENKEPKQWKYTAKYLGDATDVDSLAATRDDLAQFLYKKCTCGKCQKNIDGAFSFQAQLVADKINGIERLSTPEDRAIQLVIVQDCQKNQTTLTLNDFCDQMIQYYSLARSLKDKQLKPVPFST